MPCRRRVRVPIREATREDDEKGARQKRRKETVATRPRFGSRLVSVLVVWPVLLPPYEGGRDAIGRDLVASVMATRHDKRTTMYGSAE
ncbi:hypothetical protein pdul_cds_638 [Pandoravirus dulcis]|uniref:Uncharacterized protein n=1 Tax=Pandoravirus dulcis TaxID=1349409 RepID=S4VXH5_9VIRU|nr:hypothetical protein pdul_cds_638 [Pandoravirus dulcis]AGO82776.1 hypothetical protein pdul_cds_638 [Pandoravirus dulcis]